MDERFEILSRSPGRGVVTDRVSLSPDRPFLQAAARFLARHQLDPRQPVTFVDPVDHQFVVNWSTRSICTPSFLAMSSTRYWLVEYRLGYAETWYHLAESEADARCFILDNQLNPSGSGGAQFVIHPPGSGLAVRDQGAAGVTAPV
jgi:hypothetical protein